MSLFDNAKEINENPNCKQYWINHNGIIMTNGEDVVISVYAKNITKTAITSKRDLANKQATIFDTNTSKIYVCPTNLNATGVTVNHIKTCMENTASLGKKVRFADQEEGLDYGYFSACDFLKGKGLNILVLEKIDDVSSEEEEEFPVIHSISKSVTFKGVTYRSKTEGRFAVLFDKLNIPFKSENELECIRVYCGKKYHVDMMIYPDDDKLRSYVEIKPFYPTEEEQDKAADLAVETGIPVYIVYADDFVPPRGFDDDKFEGVGNNRRIRRDVKYTNGPRAMKFMPTDKGVTYGADYMLMANDKASSRVWEETNESLDGLTVKHNPYMEAALENGRHIFNAQELDAMAFEKVTHRHMRVVTKTKKIYRPVKVFKPHFYKKRYDFKRSWRLPGRLDWMSERMLEAYKEAREYDF